MIAAALADFRSALDAVAVGQEEAKTGVVLALLAREHAYLEGPPGCGKTWLAEACATLAGARTVAIRFHRDVRELDLLGDAVLDRRATANGERLAFRLERGPLLSAEVAILDDLSRAPGEALTPLMRVLDARRIAGRTLPLETAIATACPPSIDAYVDPVEPTQLDRFAIQIRLRGTIAAADWRHARALLDWQAPSALSAVLDGEARARLQRHTAALPVSDEVRAALVRLVYRLVSVAASDTEASITDRAFTRMAIAVLRAHALLRGASRVEMADLVGLRYMLGARVSDAVRARLESLIAEVIAEESLGLRASDVPAARRAGASGESTGQQVRTPAEPRESIDTDGATAAAFAGERAEVDRLLHALEGRVQKGRVEHGDDPGGQPRRYRRLRRLDEIFDADPLDALLFVDSRLAGMPRVFQRERRNVGGTLAVLRDVSASMEGRLSRWAGDIVAGLFYTGARRRMRIGYVEFNHRAELFRAGGRFFHRQYGRLRGLAGASRAEGRTSYEAPLRAALNEFRGRSKRNRHVVLLTDGVPVLGDPTVARERALARRLGVRIHTVFLGDGQCPPVLDTISRETDGMRFRAAPGAAGRLHVRERG